MPETTITYPMPDDLTIRGCDVDHPDLGKLWLQEGEDATAVWTVGRIDAAPFAEAVNQYDRENSGEDYGYTEYDVTLAALTCVDPDGELFEYASESDEHAVVITQVVR